MSNNKNNTTMKKPNIIVTIMSIVSVCLTFLAPIVEMKAKYGTYSNTISLFSGVMPGLCVAMTVLVGIGLVLTSVHSMTTVENPKAMMGTGVLGIIMFIMQGACAFVCMRGYDDNSFFGFLAKSVMQTSLHPLFIMTMALTLATIVASFYVKSSNNSEEVTNDGE